jgi:hypothetical protein
MFLYWFRYLCRLILSTCSLEDRRASVASANQLSFLEIQGALGGAARESLDSMRQSLTRDYAVVSDMRRSSTCQDENSSPVEDLMLRIDFNLLSLWYAATKRVSTQKARVALNEMTQIVGHFANAFGQTAADGASA